MILETLHYDMKSGQWSGPFPALDSPRTLVTAFGERGLMDNPEAMKALKRAYPQSVVVGCSGSGELVGTTVRDEVLSVTVTKFEKTAMLAGVAAVPSAAASQAVGAALAKKLNKPGLRAVFVLSDGLGVNGSELVRGFNVHLPEDVVVTGGLAGDGSRFQKTWVMLNDRVASGLVVAVGFYGEHLQVAHGSKGGWDKFGPERVVTRSEGNVLFELDGKPALAMYKEYLGEKASGLPGTGLLFPLSLRASSKDEKNLVRTILAVDEAAQSLTFAGDMPVGYLAQLMKADFDRLVGGAMDAAKAAESLGFGAGPNTLAIAVSCVGRRLVLGERTEEEVEAVTEVLPKGAKLTGFYSYGELSPYATGRCDLHNQTMTLTTFTETEQPVVRARVPAGATATGAQRPVVAAVPEVPGIRSGQLHYDMKAKRWSAGFPALDSPRTLVMAFGERALMDTPEVAAELKRAYPQSVVVGCSGSGEMVGTSVRDEVLSVSVARFGKTGLFAAMESCGAAGQSFDVGAALGKKLNKPGLRAVFVLSDGLGVNGSELVRGLNAQLPPEVVVTGGLAGDGTRFEKTWVLFNEQLVSGQVVAVGFYGEHLQVAHGSKGGWDKFGPERVVTRSEGNVLFELDGKPALAIYKEYLGEKASGLPGTGLLFPLSLRANARDEKNLVRTILAVDEATQSLTFAGDVPVGHLAQLMKADFERLVGGATDAAKAAESLGFGAGGGETLAIAVSCVGRRLVLGERTEEEVEAVMGVLPKRAKLAGFYSYGELSPYATGRCDLHNQTMTLTTFTEVAQPVVKAHAPVAAAVPAPRAGKFEPLSPSGDSDIRPLPAPVFPPALADLPPAASGLMRAPVIPAQAPAHAPAHAPAPRPPREPGRRVTRLLGADKVPSAHAVVELDRSEDVTVVRVRGKLSETFKGREVSSLAGKKLLFDLADVERITSFGVREWLQMLSELEPKGANLYFARCSEAVVNQLGMIRLFSGGGKILSFFAPYLCARCGAQFSTLLDCQEDAAALEALDFPAVDCPSCGNTSAFDDDARSYLSFGPVPHVAPAEVQRAVDGLPAIGQVDPVEKFIDGRVNRVRINARLDEALRWPRVFDGLEGDVVLELASSPGSTPGGISALAAALKRLPQDVDSLQLEGTPASLLEVLSTGKRDPRLSVGTALVEGHCPTCATARPVQLRVEDATEALRNGREPYAVCKRCNATLSFEKLHGLLERLAGEESRKLLREELGVVSPPGREPGAEPSVAPAPQPATVASASRISTAAAVGIGMGVLNVALLGMLVLRGPLFPPAPAPVPDPVVVAPPAPVEPKVELPPAWADVAFAQEGESFFAVGRARAQANEEAAIAAARTDALFAVVKAAQGKLAGSAAGSYLAGHVQGDLEGNLAPIVKRFEKQVGAQLPLQRTDAELKRKDGEVSGPVRYKLSAAAFQEVVAFYGALGSGLGLEVGRFFPTLEASTRTEAELVVLSVAEGVAKEQGVAVGDLLTEVNGKSLTSPAAFAEATAELQGSSVTLKLESAGTPREVVLALPKRAGTGH